MESEKFKRQLKEASRELEELIASYLPPEEGLQKTVLEAMNYSVLAGGKRLRPLLMRETYRMWGGTGREIAPFLAAMEMIHTYSLIHDDLPAMDNDEYRRGRQTTWKAYGEAMGILAGDGLLNYAYETALKAFAQVDREDAKALCRVSRALEVLAKEAGIWGMVGGQAVDVEAAGSGKALSEEALYFIHRKKTGALIKASMQIGAILAGADEAEQEALGRCAENIGIAFQIQDDILDVEGDSMELGKPVGSDAALEKQTYVTLKGLEQARAEVKALSEEAVSSLRAFPGDHDFLETLILSLIHRRK